MFRFPGTSFPGPRPPLTTRQERLRDDLSADLQHLAVDIGERNVFRSGSLARAETFIEGTLEDTGLEVQRQSYEAAGATVANLFVEIPGRDEGIVVVGAHYDTVSGCPGANDNGTGVVASLALARAFSEASPNKTLRFVLFVNEEPPFFQGTKMGSWVYAQGCRERSERVEAMLSLETIGYFDDAEDTQTWQIPFGSVLYPTTANFITFVGNVRSRRLVRKSVKAFRKHATIGSEGAAVPGWITGVGWSDHWSFWKAGYRAVMVTDTAPFRYPEYHTPQDTIDRIDFDGFTRVVDGLRHVVADLAGCEAP